MTRATPHFLFFLVLCLTGCELRYSEPGKEVDEARSEVTFVAEAIPLGDVPPQPEDLGKYSVRIRAYETLTSTYRILKQRNEPLTRRITVDTKFDHLTFIDESKPVFEDLDVTPGTELVYQVTRPATKTHPATYQDLTVSIPNDLLVAEMHHAESGDIVNPIYGRVLVTASGVLSFPSSYFRILANRIDFQDGARIEIHPSSSSSNDWPLLHIKSEITSGKVAINLTNPARQELFERIETDKTPTLDPYRSPSMSIQAKEGALNYLIEDPPAPANRSKLARFLKTMSWIQVGDEVSWIIDGKRVSPLELGGFFVGTCDATGDAPALYFSDDSTAFAQFDSRPNSLVARWSAEPLLRAPSFSDNQLTFYYSIAEENMMIECRYTPYRPELNDESQLARLFRLDSALKFASRARTATGCELSFMTADKEKATVVSVLQLEVADYFRKFPDKVQEACSKSFTTKISFFLSTEPYNSNPGDGHRIIPSASKLSASEIWGRFLDGAISFEE